MKRTNTKRIHYITNAVGTQHRTFNTVAEAKEYVRKRSLLSVAKEKYKLMAQLVKNKLYNA